MDQKIMGAGVVSLLVGFALGNVTADRSPKMEDIRAALGAEMEAAGSAVDGMSASVQEQFAALGDRLGALEEQLGSGSDAMGAIGSRIDGLSEELRTTLSEQQTAVSDGISALGARIESAAAAAGSTAQGGSGTAEEVAEEMSPADPIEGGTELRVGETAMLADGALRAFLSRATEDAARLSVGGEMIDLAVGRSGTVGDCEVTLNGTDGAVARLSATCGGSGGDAEDSASTEAEMSGDGTGVGEIALVGDGAARVFVSGIAADGSAARIAVNGIATQAVAVGERAEVGDEGCAVTVEAISGNRVSLGYACDS